MEINGTCENLLIVSSIKHLELATLLFLLLPCLARASLGSLGVNTLRKRQSSLPTTGSLPSASRWPRRFSCTQGEPNALAFRGLRQGRVGTGNRKKES